MDLAINKRLTECNKTHSADVLYIARSLEIVSIEFLFAVLFMYVYRYKYRFINPVIESQ